ncbi:uncharacterized protein LOC107850834 isoform X2 [Capsicum annuum]|uniref:uncharacterized protein LOC107850834 isoform X2 n=1 Tax=Capsicum annuum TaxID=4072 RepID=UPI001FB10473|nr:uncharacterized protein LOC107850834 isoform X2 [Capsicum annuum]
MLLNECRRSTVESGAITLAGGPISVVGKGGGSNILATYFSTNLLESDEKIMKTSSLHPLIGSDVKNFGKFRSYAGVLLPPFLEQFYQRWMSVHGNCWP